MGEIYGVIYKPHGGIRRGAEPRGRICQSLRKAPPYHSINHSINAFIKTFIEL